MTKDEILKQVLGQPPMQLQQTVIATLCNGKMLINGEDSDPCVIEIRVYGHSQKSLVHVEVK
jgi:hypothetical protein